MEAWVCWPAHDLKRSNDTAREWIHMGWRVAVAIDDVMPNWAITPQNIVSHAPPFVMKPWGGYYTAVSFLSLQLCVSYNAGIVCCASDSIIPDQRAHAKVVSAAFIAKFPNLLGVLQPVAEVWKPTTRGESARPYMPGRLMHATRPSIERCESPILGRAWILEMYQGKGPFAEKYHQYFADHELHDVASKMGVLWKNKALLHRHDHWSKTNGHMKPYQIYNFDKWYEQDYAMFRTRRSKDFPESERRASGLRGNGLSLPSNKLWTPS